MDAEPGSQCTLTPVDELYAGEYSRLLLCQSSTGRPRLVKIIRTAAGHDVASRATREVSLALQVVSPFVVASEGWLLAPGGELHILLEYLPGGDLGLLMDREPIGVDSARFYIGCAALGLAALHEQGNVHRDVKPDNICIDGDGYAKLVDLGYARGLPTGERAQTLLGTPEYLSPEGFLGEGQDSRSDMWSLGATLYTLITSSHPWGGSDPEAIYHNVLNQPLFIPNNMHSMPAASDFLRICLSRDPDARPTADSVWAHPFFTSPPSRLSTCTAGALEREALLGRSERPPFVPCLADPLDTSYFSEVEDSDDEGTVGAPRPKDLNLVAVASVLTEYHTDCMYHTGLMPAMLPADKREGAAPAAQSLLRLPVEPSPAALEDDSAGTLLTTSCTPGPEVR